MENKIFVVEQIAVKMVGKSTREEKEGRFLHRKYTIHLIQTSMEFEEDIEDHRFKSK